MTACASGTSIGLFYTDKSNEPVIIKRKLGSDDVFHVCVAQSKGRMYRIHAEVEGLPLAELLKRAICEGLVA